MNFCEHGLYQQNCPVCRRASGIKPPTQLVKPAPRKIPVPIAREKQFLQKKHESLDESIFKPNQLITPVPDKPNRIYDLRKKLEGTKDTLFDLRKNKLASKYDVDKTLHNNEVKTDIEDIKGSFLKK